MALRPLFVVSLMFVLISIVSSQTTVPNSISVYPTIRTPCSSDYACSSDATYKACTQSTSGTKFCGRKVSYPADGSTYCSSNGYFDCKSPAFPNCLTSPRTDGTLIALCGKLI